MEIEGLMGAGSGRGRVSFPKAEASSAEQNEFQEVMRARAAQQTMAAANAGGGANRVNPLESMLKRKYPGLVYHVMDTLGPYWGQRNDYPFHKLFQEGTDPREIQNWTPSGPDPSPSDPRVQANVQSIPPGSKAVVVHPAVQMRMQEDPAYAQLIMKRIDAWFAFDAARSGAAGDVSQCVSIGADGNICGTVSVTPTRLVVSGEDDDGEFWTRRLALHKENTERWQAEQIRRGMDAASQWAMMQASRAAKSYLAALIGVGELQGETPEDFPPDDVLAQTEREIAAQRMF